MCPHVGTVVGRIQRQIPEQTTRRGWSPRLRNASIPVWIANWRVPHSSSDARAAASNSDNASRHAVAVQSAIATSPNRTRTASER